MAQGLQPVGLRGHNRAMNRASISVTTPIENRKLYAWVAIVSSCVLGFLLWLIYGREPGAAGPVWVGALPAVNAALNSATATCLIFGYRAVRRGDTDQHRRWMIGALLISSLFLLGYVTYHHFQGDTHFVGQGVVRPVYFFILITHILASMVAVPLVLTTVFFAATGRFDRHRRLARRTLPVWLYVSITGVVVFFLLRTYS